MKNCKVNEKFIHERIIWNFKNSFKCVCMFLLYYEGRIVGVEKHIEYEWQEIEKEGRKIISSIPRKNIYVFSRSISGLLFNNSEKNWWTHKTEESLVSSVLHNRAFISLSDINIVHDKKVRITKNNMPRVVEVIHLWVKGKFKHLDKIGNTYNWYARCFPITGCDEKYIYFGGEYPGTLEIDNEEYMKALKLKLKGKIRYTI